MNTSHLITDQDIFALANGHRLQWEEAQQTYVLLYPEGMVTLNPSASAILNKLIEGRCFAEWLAELEQAYNVENLRPDVTAFLTDALENGWIVRQN